MTKEGPKLIEYNARFGDPECQVIMRRLQSDVMDILVHAEAGTLGKCPAPAWFDEPVVNVVMAAKGYPGSYKKGSKIEGLEAANEQDGIVVFHAGTKRDEKNNVCAAGGRVLNVTAQAGSVSNAVAAAYKVIDENIDWPEGFCRRDIAHHAL